MYCDVECLESDDGYFYTCETIKQYDIKDNNSMPNSNTNSTTNDSTDDTESTNTTTNTTESESTVSDSKVDVLLIAILVPFIVLLVAVVTLSIIFCRKLNKNNKINQLTVAVEDNKKRPEVQYSTLKKKDFKKELTNIQSFM